MSSVDVHVELTQWSVFSERQHVEAGFRRAYGIPPFIEVSPDTILRNLAHDIAALRQHIHELKEELLMFEDLKQFKVWLKRLKRQQAAIRFVKMPL